MNCEIKGLIFCANSNTSQAVTPPPQKKSKKKAKKKDFTHMNQRFISMEVCLSFVLFRS